MTAWRSYAPTSRVSEGLNFGLAGIGRWLAGDLHQGANGVGVAQVGLVYQSDNPCWAPLAQCSLGQPRQVGGSSAQVGGCGGRHQKTPSRAAVLKTGSVRSRKDVRGPALRASSVAQFTRATCRD